MDVERTRVRFELAMHEPIASHRTEPRRATLNRPAAANVSRSAMHEGPEHTVPGAISLAREQEARSRLGAELRAIALDLIGLYDSEELPAHCAAWVRTTIEAAVAGIHDPAVAAIAGHLRAQLAVAPPDIARLIDQARRRHEAGFA